MKHWSYCETDSIAHVVWPDAVWWHVSNIETKWLKHISFHFAYDICAALLRLVFLFRFQPITLFSPLFLLFKESSNALDISISMQSGWLSLLCPHVVSLNNKMMTTTATMVATEKGISIWRNYRWNTCHSATQLILCHTGFFRFTDKFCYFQIRVIIEWNYIDFLSFLFSNNLTRIDFRSKSK